VIAEHLVTIDDVERRGGLDVLWELPDDLEGRLEKALNADWAAKHFH
jgi:hypothetical protein